MPLRIATLVFCGLAAAPALAGFDEGVAAYERHDCVAAERELRPVAEAGNAVAQRLMGWIAYRCGESVPDPYRWRLQVDTNAVTEGRADAEKRLSVEYGWTMPFWRDGATAAQWFRRAAEGGDAVAQFMLASFLDRGMWVARDHGAAVAWLRKAAACKVLRADYFVAIHYRDGLGVSQDRSAAFEWFRTAAGRGDRDAPSEVGRMYLQGDGVPPDYVEALKWLGPAAEGGHAVAQNYLGTMHRDGAGVSPDLVQAYKWFDLAMQADKYHEFGIQDVATQNWLEVGRRMTPAQIGGAVKLAKDWHPTRQETRRRRCQEAQCCRSP